MQKAGQYRQFADALALAAQDATDETRDLMLGLARTWSRLADEADDAVAHTAQVIDFPGARLQRRSRMAIKVG